MAFPSTFQDLQNAVMAKTRLDPANPLDASKVKDWINQVYARVVLEVEFLTGNTTVALNPNLNQYQMPTQAKRIKWMTIMQQGQNFYGPPLRLVSMDEILWRRVASGGSGFTNGTATHYAFSGPNNIDVWPTPGAADTMLMYYVAYPTPLAANTDVPQIDEPYASKLIEYGTLIDASEYIKDTIATYQFPQVFNDWMYRFRQHMSRKEGTQSKDFRIPGPRYPAPHDRSMDIGV